MRELERAGKLSWNDLLHYGSAISEDRQDLSAAERGIALMSKALSMVLPPFQADASNAQCLGDVFKCCQSLSGMLLWKWMLTGRSQDLDAAIEMFKEGEKYGKQVQLLGEAYAIGRIAQLQLRLLLMLRIRDQDRDREDVEGYRDAVLQLRAMRSHDPREVSYLRWIQIIAMVDDGNSEGVHQAVAVALVEDEKIRQKYGCADIGRRQYSLIRRFIEHNSRVLRNPSLVGYVSRMLRIRSVLAAKV